MNVTLPYLEFRSLIARACSIIESSEVGRDIMSSDYGPLFDLTASGQSIKLVLGTKGVEVMVTGETTECAEEGTVSINPFILKRMSVKADTINLTDQADAVGPAVLKIKAGRFKTEISIGNKKQTRYDLVPLTHEVPSKLLMDSIAATALDSAKDSQPFSRLKWGPNGVRVWTHNPYNAAHSVVLEEKAEALDCVVPVNLMREVAASSPKGTVRIGTDGQVLRISTLTVDVSHPLKSDVKIDDIEDMIGGLDPNTSGQTFEVDPASLHEALVSVGSVDRAEAGTPKVGVMISVSGEKQKMVVSVMTPAGRTTYKIDVKTNAPNDLKMQLNHKQLSDFVGRSKGQKLIFGVMPDRAVLWAGTTTYVLAPVQEDEDA